MNEQMNDFRHFIIDGRNRVILGLRQQMERLRRERRAPEISFWLFYSLQEELKETLNSILSFMKEQDSIFDGFMALAQPLHFLLHSGDLGYILSAN